MHIFSFNAGSKLTSAIFLTNLLQSSDELFTFVRRDDARVCQHFGVGLGACQVIFDQLHVKADTGIKSGDRGMQRRLKSLAPSFSLVRSSRVCFSQITRRGLYGIIQSKSYPDSVINLLNLIQ